MASYRFSLQASDASLALFASSYQSESPYQNHSKFFVQRPSEKFLNNRDQTFAVIETLDTSAASAEILRPAKVVAEFYQLNKKYYVECEGPARSLTYEEYIKLIAKLSPEHPDLIPDWLKSRIPQPATSSFSFSYCTIL